MLRVSGAQKAANGRLAISFPSKAGKTYVVQSATSLAVGDWGDCQYATTEAGALQSDPIPGTGGTVTVYVEPAGTSGFYRVAVQP